MQLQGLGVMGWEKRNSRRRFTTTNNTNLHERREKEKKKEEFEPRMVRITLIEDEEDK